MGDEKIRSLSIHLDTFWEFVHKIKLTRQYSQEDNNWYTQMSDSYISKNHSMSHLNLYVGYITNIVQISCVHYSNDGMRKMPNLHSTYNVHTIVTKGGVWLHEFDEFAEFFKDLSIMYHTIKVGTKDAPEFFIHAGPMIHLYPKSLKRP